MDENLKILLCEDDENLGMLLREYLAAKGYTAELCPDGEAGYKAFLKSKFDICVLDVMMPKKDGFTLAQEIRSANAEIPIIFLTAKTLKEDILEGFKIGADDYITKPFRPRELIARIRAALRKTDCSPAVFDRNGLSVDVASGIVKKNGKEVFLSALEYRLLLVFVNNPPFCRLFACVTARKAERACNLISGMRVVLIQEAKMAQPASF